MYLYYSSQKLMDLKKKPFKVNNIKCKEFPENNYISVVQNFSRECMAFIDA